MKHLLLFDVDLHTAQLGGVLGFWRPFAACVMVTVLPNLTSR